MSTQSNSDRFYVITGGPGSGKTSLLDALAARGYERSLEAGRALIQQQVAIGGRALPWADRVLFSELMLSWEIRSYQMAEKIPGLVFFDRGVPDIAGYLTLLKFHIPDHVRKASEIFRYNRRVFVAPPWPEIYTQDVERKQDFAEAVRTYQALCDTYLDQGYEIHELPRATVAERVRFVLAVCPDATQETPLLP
jgi:predicted ATPase